MRFVVAARKSGHAVKVFLMGEAVEIETMTHEVYEVAAQVRLFHEHGCEIQTCGTCLVSVGMESSRICPMNRMRDCLDMVEWAEQVLTF